MSLDKEAWASAIRAYDSAQYEAAITAFTDIGESSKVLVNQGLIYTTLGKHREAADKFSQATALDNHLAVAYFQLGASYFHLEQYENALESFEGALRSLRGNEFINYEQLGLEFKLFSAEVIFNKGLTRLRLNRTTEGLADLDEARKHKATEAHGVIDSAIKARGTGHTVFSIPDGLIYRPGGKPLQKTEFVTVPDIPADVPIQSKPGIFARFFRFLFGRRPSN